MKLRTLATTAAASAAVVASILLTSGVANATIPNFPGPAKGWQREWTSPSSYCKTVRTEYITWGYKVTACTLYGDSEGTGGFFDYRPYKPGEPR